MTKTISTKDLFFRLPVTHIVQPLKFEQPVVVMPEDEYRELLEDMDDLKEALKAEEEYLSTGGRLFVEYDKERRKKNR